MSRRRSGGRAWREGLRSGDGEFREVCRLHRTRTQSADGTWLVVEASNAQGRVALCGEALVRAAEGQNVLVVGAWQHHDQYGAQVRVSEIADPPSTDLGAMQENITSYRISYIGAARARKLIELYGEQAIAIMDADPVAALRGLPGLNDKQIIKAAADWRAARPHRALIDVLGSTHARLADRAVKLWGVGAIERIKDNPYELMHLRGVGFVTADDIALRIGYPPQGVERAKAAIEHLLLEAEGRGHCYLSDAELCARAEQMHARSRDPGRAIEIRSEHLQSLISKGAVKRDTDRIYRRATYERERAVALRVAQLTTWSHLPFRRARIDRTRSFEGLSLQPEQWDGIAMALRHGLSVITGPPGSGKSTLQHAMVTLAQEADPRAQVTLMAPTNRAAARLTSASGLAATTIHAALGWRPGQPPMYGRGNPLDSRLIIVDEFSMADLLTAETIFNAVGRDCHICLVGDEDQLPSVGAGRVLGDLIASGVVPVTRLTKIIRQADHSMIRRAAQAIRSEQIPVDTYGDAERQAGLRRDFFIRRTEQITADARQAAGRPLDEEQALIAVRDKLVQIACVGLPTLVAKTCEERPIDDLHREMQVFSPEYAGPLGVDALNVALREQLNPDGAPVLGGRLRVGDKIIETNGQSGSTLANAEMAFIRADLPGKRHLELERFDDATRLFVPYSACRALRLAYCTTVHKAQGCEARLVLCVVHHSHFVLDRHLFYTAITRAKGHCVVVASEEGLRVGVTRAQAQQRNTHLAHRLIPLIGHRDMAPGAIRSRPRAERATVGGFFT